jgi:hypothetical protein
LHVHDANAHMKILNKALCYFIWDITYHIYDVKP